VLLDREAKAGHNRCADATRYRQSHQPCYDNVAEDRPVDVLSSSESPDKHNGPDLAVRRTDGYADIRGDQHRQCGADLDTKTTATNHEQFSLLVIQHRNEKLNCHEQTSTSSLKTTGIKKARLSFPQKTVNLR